MCGIAGILSTADKSQDAQRARLIQAHRGPDATAVSTVQLGKYQVNFTHNRLSIIDLHEHSNQPFWDETNSFCVIFNGEIYNYLEIRKELESLGVSFRTQSDTEVLLKALIHWDADVVFNKLNGMWSLAFLDKNNQRLLFARDRFGKKPFYYHHNQSEIYWSSEIKYILKTSQRKFEPNRETIARYLQQFLLESDESQTFFKDIVKLPPGSFVWIDLKNDKIEIQPQKYYKFPRKPFAGTKEEAQEQLDFLLNDSVKLRLRSDVNVGFLLSGGLDSSILTGIGCHLMADEKEHSLKFLSVVSEDPRYDESPHIREVEKHLGIESAKINIAHSSNHVFDLLSKVQWHNDEPITSFSAVTYYLMMEKARELDAKVLLTGQGADEIFCGYKKYLGFYLKSLLGQSHFLKATSVAFDFMKTRSLVSEIHLGELKRYVNLLNRGTINILSKNLKSLPQPSIGLGTAGVTDRQLSDLFTFSVPALLHYEDRLSMAFGREVRAPFLDYRIAEFGVNLPMDLKIHNGWSKFILREVSKPYTPKNITWRKDKKGFTIPQESWFKAALRPEIERVIKGDSLMYELNLVDKSALVQKFELFCGTSHQSKMISFKEIFAPIALENWLNIFAESLDK